MQETKVHQQWRWLQRRKVRKKKQGALGSSSLSTPSSLCCSRRRCAVLRPHSRHTALAQASRPGRGVYRQSFFSQAFMRHRSETFCSPFWHAAATLASAVCTCDHRKEHAHQRELLLPSAPARARRRLRPHTTLGRPGCDVDEDTTFRTSRHLLAAHPDDRAAKGAVHRSAAARVQTPAQRARRARRSGGAREHRNSAPAASA